jgi:signal transduction histidine kinase
LVWRQGEPIRIVSQRIRALSIALLVAAWTVDMFTPQPLVAAILLTVPVAVASLYVDLPFARVIIIAALAADIAAGWYNGWRDGGHWDAIAIGNRVLAAFSIVLVGALGSRARAATQQSERLAAHRLLAERGEVIRDIVHAISHDLRTPLAATAMTLQQAIDGKYGVLPPEYQDILRRSVESNNELRRLAETLLLVARYESGEYSQLRRQVSLERLVRSVVDELEPLWSEKHIHVSITNEDQSVVRGDEAELRRAIINLFANAIKATPEEGDIALQLSRNGAHALLSIEDTGYGVADERRASLFERIPASDVTPHGAGSGLGLYIVRRIAEQHGGSVSYAPRDPNGSVFVIVLPLESGGSTHDS